MNAPAGFAPPMYVVTDALSSGPRRVTFKRFQGRQVRQSVLIAGILCGIPGFLVGLIIGQFILGFWASFYGAALGIAVGYVLVTWSPWKYESLWKMLLVQSRSVRGRIAYPCKGEGERPLIDFDKNDDPQARCPHCRQPVQLSAGQLAAGITIPAHEMKGKVYIGVCALDRVILGPVTLMSRTVDVPVGSYDHDGIPVAVRPTQAMWVPPATAAAA